MINVLFIYPQLAPQHRGVLRADHLAAVLPVVTHAVGGRIFGENIAHLTGQRAQRIRVRALNAHFNRAIPGGAEHNAFSAGVHLRVVSGDPGFHVAGDGGDAALVVHPHHNLRVVAVLPLAAVGKNKTHTALANGGDGGDYPWLAGDRPFNITGHLLGGVNVGTVGEPQVDKENGRIR